MVKEVEKPPAKENECESNIDERFSIKTFKYEFKHLT